MDERRRRLYVHAVTWQLELSPIGLQLRQLNRAASASNRSEIRLLSEPVAVLAQRVATVATPRKWKRVFCAVMRAIAEPLPDYAQPTAPRPSPPARSRKTRTFLEVKVLSTRARSICQGSGLAPFQGSLLPAYFERLTRDLPLALALNEESQYAAAVYFISLLGVAPRDFLLVSLVPNADAVHLDVERGVLRWPIRGLVKTLPRWQRDDFPIASVGDDWVEVPQAEELMQWARARLASRPGSTSLDQLFDLEAADWIDESRGIRASVFTDFARPHDGTIDPRRTPACLRGRPRRDVRGCLLLRHRTCADGRTITTRHFARTG